ncbi:unnamed protein product [Closterium sp. NIES-54]
MEEQEEQEEQGESEALEELEEQAAQEAVVALEGLELGVLVDERGVHPCPNPQRRVGGTIHAALARQIPSRS